jgi:hypothetical protein
MRRGHIGLRLAWRQPTNAPAEAETAALFRADSRAETALRARPDHETEYLWTSRQPGRTARSAERQAAGRHRETLRWPPWLRCRGLRGAFAMGRFLDERSAASRCSDRLAVAASGPGLKPIIPTERPDVTRRRISGVSPIASRKAGRAQGPSRATLTPEQVRYDLKRKLTSSTSSAGLPEWRLVDTYSCEASWLGPSSPCMSLDRYTQSTLNVARHAKKCEVEDEVQSQIEYQEV